MTISREKKIFHATITLLLNRFCAYHVTEQLYVFSSNHAMSVKTSRAEDATFFVPHEPILIQNSKQFNSTWFRPNGKIKYYRNTLPKFDWYRKLVSKFNVWKNTRDSLLLGKCLRAASVLIWLVLYMKLLHENYFTIVWNNFQYINFKFWNHSKYNLFVFLFLIFSDLQFLIQVVKKFEVRFDLNSEFVFWVRRM